MTKPPVAFMSYARFDDEHDSGRLSSFCKRLSGEVRLQTGEEFPIFQDRTDIAWGEEWQQRVDESIAAVTFLIPILTPSFFRSRPCRDELARFAARERKLGQSDLILPVHYVTCAQLEDESKREADTLAKLLAGRQIMDWRELRFEPITSPLVARALALMSSQIARTLERAAPAARPAAKDIADAKPMAHPLQREVFHTPSAPAPAPDRGSGVNVTPSTAGANAFARKDQSIPAVFLLFLRAIASKYLISVSESKLAEPDLDPRTRLILAEELRIALKSNVDAAEELAKSSLVSEMEREDLRRACTAYWQLNTGLAVEERSASIIALAKSIYHVAISLETDLLVTIKTFLATDHELGTLLPRRVIVQSEVSHSRVLIRNSMLRRFLREILSNLRHAYRSMAADAPDPLMVLADVAHDPMYLDLRLYDPSPEFRGWSTGLELARLLLEPFGGILDPPTPLDVSDPLFQRGYRKSVGAFFLRTPDPARSYRQ
jgi:hypothetical protein